MNKLPFKYLLERAEDKGLFERHAEMKHHLSLFDGNIGRLSEAMLENDITAALFDHTFMKEVFGDSFERVMKDAVMIDDWQERLNYVSKEAHEQYDISTSQS